MTNLKMMFCEIIMYLWIIIIVLKNLKKLKPMLLKKITWLLVKTKNQKYKLNQLIFKLLLNKIVIIIYLLKIKHFKINSKNP